MVDLREDKAGRGRVLVVIALFFLLTGALLGTVVGSEEDLLAERNQLVAELEAGNYSWLLNTSLRVERIEVSNYSCSGTGYHTVKVLTPGVHNQMFNFSGQVAYAENFALEDVSGAGGTIVDTNRTQYWNSGDFNNTNTTADNETIVLANASASAYYSSGNFTSAVFDAGGVSSWDNISWIEGVPYGEELPDNQADELETTLGGANMTGNVLLMHLNNDSDYGENNTWAYDFSGNGNNGTFSVVADTDSGPNSSGKLGGAFMFDGDGDYVEVGNDGGLNPSNGLLTACVWIKADSLSGGGDNVIISKYETGGYITHV